MRAGQLDRTITIQTYSSTIHPGTGQPIASWTDLETVRAQVVQSSTEEFMRNYGVSEVTATVFRIRWLDGIKPEDRIVYQGTAHNIVEIKEIGRRRGLEIRTAGSGEAVT